MIKENSIRYIIFTIFFLQLCEIKANYDSSRITKMKPQIDLEFIDFSIDYSESKKSNPNRTPVYNFSQIISYYHPIYRNFSLSPILGYDYYRYIYDNNKYSEKKYVSIGSYYGLGLEKKVKFKNSSSIGFGVQKVFFSQNFYHPDFGKSNSKADLFRFRFSANTTVYKRIGLTGNLNFIANDNQNEYTSLGHYRDVNFTFGLYYKFGAKVK